MLSPRARANLLLLLTAAIWGFSFVAQRTGMDHLGPFAFNAARFAAGSLVLVPVMMWNDRRRPSTDHRQAGGWRPAVSSRRSLLAAGLAAGAVLFAAAALQQSGIVFTTAGKTGFITSLYVVLVPVLGLVVGLRPPAVVWLGAALAVVGLYFLTIEGGLQMVWGDLLVLAGAVMWAVHFLVLGRLSPGADPLRLAFAQFVVCAALSAAAALLLEQPTAAGLRAAAAPILFSGIFSVGLGYTLQVIAQRDARPADTAIILSLEAVFAVIGGALLLGEQLTSRALAGCALMLAGILLSQLVGRPDEQTVDLVGE
jgi:drug/metabolite transporter (DMT)-like permease